MAKKPPTPSEKVRPSDRRRSPAGPVLTLEAITTAAIAILDADGSEGLNLRRLSGDLGVSVASLYWHIDDKQDLLDQCTWQVMAPMIDEQRAAPVDPLRWREQIIELALAQFDVINAHPWITLQGQLLTTDRMRPPDLLQIRAWDRLGSLVLASGLDAQDAFEAMTAISSHLLATMAVAGRAAASIRSGVARDAALDAVAHEMSALAQNPEEDLPFLATQINIMATHDEQQQFLGALNFVLDGIELRAARKRNTQE